MARNRNCREHGRGESPGHSIVIILIVLVLASMQWERINFDRLLGNIDCRWQYGPAMCRDWHRR